MRIFHLGQHHEFYSAADIYDLCFALALAPTSIGEFDVSAFCIDVEQAGDADLRVNRAHEHFDSHVIKTPQPELRDGNGPPWGC